MEYCDSLCIERRSRLDIDQASGPLSLLFFKYCLFPATRVVKSEKILHPLHSPEESWSKGTVPVVANGGFGDTTGTVPFREERLVRIGQPARAMCDAGHIPRPPHAHALERASRRRSPFSQHSEPGQPSKLTGYIELQNRSERSRPSKGQPVTGPSRRGMKDDTCAMSVPRHWHYSNAASPREARPRIAVVMPRSRHSARLRTWSPAVWRSSRVSLPNSSGSSEPLCSCRYGIDALGDILATQWHVPGCQWVASRVPFLSFENFRGPVLGLFCVFSRLSPD
jgi:hypothetical protein